MRSKTSFTKKKSEPALGFRTPSFFRAKNFGSRGSTPHFDPGRFKTQHKG